MVRVLTRDYGVARHLGVDNERVGCENHVVTDGRVAEHTDAGVENRSLTERGVNAFVGTHRAALIDGEVVAVGRVSDHAADRVNQQERFRHRDTEVEVEPIHNLVQIEELGRNCGVATGPIDRVSK